MIDKLSDIRSKLLDIHSVLRNVSYYLVHRDEMNAKIHCADVRLSPLTIKVRDATTQIARLIRESGGKVIE